jgi:protoporphyrinogen IX oxidase
MWFSATAKFAPELSRPRRADEPLRLVMLRFMTGLGFLTVGLALVLWGGYGVGRSAGWMHAKLDLVLGLVVYHAYCAILYLRFAGGGNTRSHVWFRWFNEIPVLLLIAIVALAVGKPF